MAHSKKSTRLVTARDRTVRCAALRNLDDPALLLRIAVEDEVEEVRQAAIVTLMQWALFDRVGVDDKTAWFGAQGIREVTLQITKLRDQALLARFALEGKYTCLRCAAVGNLTDQTLLAKIARADKNSEVVRASVSRITDQSVLAGIAADGLDNYARFHAIKRLSDETTLMQVALHEKFRNDVRSQEPGDSRYRDNGLRCVAVSKISDQAILARIAVETPYIEVMRAALDRMLDKAALVIIAEDTRSKSKQEAARRRLDQIHSELQCVSIESVAKAKAARVKVTTDELPRRPSMGEFTQVGETANEVTATPESAEIGDETALESLLAAVRSRNFRESSAACSTLGKIKPAGAASTLLAFLVSADKYLASRIAFALRKLADTSVLKALIREFTLAQDPYWRGDLAAAIAATGGTDAASLLVPLLHDRSTAPYIRKSIASGFGDSREPSALDELIAAYRRYPESPNGDEADFCEACLSSISKYGDPKTIELLCGELLWSHSHRTPAIARDGLICVGALAVPALIEVLERLEGMSNVSEYERGATVSALVSIGGNAAIRAVKRAIDLGF